MCAPYACTKCPYVFIGIHPCRYRLKQYDLLGWKGKEGQCSCASKLAEVISAKGEARAIAKFSHAQIHAHTSFVCHFSLGENSVLRRVNNWINVTVTEEILVFRK